MNKFRKPMGLILPLVCILALQNNSLYGNVVKTRTLSHQKSIKIKRFLHPMPQEFRLSKVIYQIPVNDCSININLQASSGEKRAIDKFKEHWLKKYNTALKQTDNDLSIIASLSDNSSLLQSADKKRLIDLKYLAERPNSEQAYLISTAVEKGKVKIYVVANTATGLNYGLLTLEQLFASLSQGNMIIFPQVNIVDWPDIKERGFALNVGGQALYDESNGLLKRYADLKLNIHYDTIYMHVDDNKMIYYSKVLQKRREGAEKYFISAIPVLSHMDYLFNPKLNALSNFSEIAAVGKIGKRIYGSHSGKTFCYSNPKSQIIVDQIFEAIAENKLGNRLQVWMGETPTCCHCSKCKGDQRQHFIREIKHILHGYNKALAINPKLKLDILFTQATYPYNYDIIKHIPKNIGIDIYAGSGANNTYKSRFGEYYLTPQSEEFVARGYVTGGLPSLGPALGWNDIAYPAYMSQMAKLRIAESKNRGLTRVVFWMPYIFCEDLNFNAAAEFSWNVNGRSSREFITAWATRNGMKKPAEVATIIKKLEYPIRALTSGMRTRNMVKPIKRMVSLLNGKKSHWGPYFEISKGFEYSNHAELVRTLKSCEQAVKMAKTLKNKDLIASALLLKEWIVIVERYTLFLTSKNAVQKAKIREDIKKSVSALPQLYKNWIELQQLPSRQFKRANDGFNNKIIKEFKKLK